MGEEDQERCRECELWWLELNKRPHRVVPVHSRTPARPAERESPPRQRGKRLSDVRIKTRSLAVLAGWLAGRGGGFCGTSKTLHGSPCRQLAINEYDNGGKKS